MSEDIGTLVDRKLAQLTGQRGVTAAAVVDDEGFVTHIRRDFEIDTDALGAAVQISLGAAVRSSEHVGQSETNFCLIENGDGIIVLAPLDGGFALAVVADRSAMLGSVRFEMKRAIPDINRAFR